MNNRNLTLFGAALLALGLAAPALAKDQPPDLQACIERTADATGPIVQAFHACYNESTGWWDNKLNANYRKAREVCAAAPKPEECREKLQRAERLWMQYRDAMSEAFDQVSAGAGMGAMPSRGSVYRATRRQAEELDFFVRQGEELAAGDATVLVEVRHEPEAEGKTPVTLKAMRPLTLTCRELERGDAGFPDKPGKVKSSHRLAAGESLAFIHSQPLDAPTQAVCARPESGPELCWLPRDDESDEGGRFIMAPGFILKN